MKKSGKEYRKWGGLMLAALFGIGLLNCQMTVLAQEKRTDTPVTAEETQENGQSALQQEKEEMKGVWIATVCNLDFPTVQTTDAGFLAAEIDTQIANCKKLGFNTIFLQVRPSSDAIYPSALFPWSAYVTGQQGTAPQSGFDPLAYWIDRAHENKMELHAWLNPYRITKYGEKEFLSLAPSNPARQHPEWVRLYSDNNYYFDPGIPQVRELIKQGVAELLEHYELDGIHMDDYFYPGKNFDDAQTFALYNGGFASIEDWRRNNVDILVQELGVLIHSYGTDIQFGISPAGVWENSSANPLGSNTQGGHPSYSKLYADTRKWALEEWIDYIVPQLYWQIGHPKADYATLAQWWAQTLKDSNTRLYIGMGDYLSIGTGSQSVWAGGAEIGRQLSYNDGLEKIEGEVHFRYGTIMKDTLLQQVIEEAYR